MNQKQIGTILIIVGLLLVVFLFMAKTREDAYIDILMQGNGGSCYLDDGSCLHEDRSFASYIFGGALAATLILFGLYLAFFDRTQEVLAKHQLKLSNALESAAKQEKEKDEFSAFLAGFSVDEQKILKAVKEQEGILQSTLRFRTGMSKTTLSLILKSLEERELVSRKPEGKTNKVFLRKKF